MLAQTVRKNLKDINNLKMRTKATKFSKLFSTAPTVAEEDNELIQVLSGDGLMEISPEDDLYEQIISEDESDFENELNYVSIYDSDEDFDIVEDSDDFEICEEDNSEEIAEYITENPDEVVVEFPICSDIEQGEKLPFFQSIRRKLAAA